MNYNKLRTGNYHLSICVKCRKKVGFWDTKYTWDANSKQDSNSNIKYNGDVLCEKCFNQMSYEKNVALSEQELPAKSKNTKRCNLCHYSTKSVLQTPKNNPINLTGGIVGTGIIRNSRDEYWACSKFDFEITNRLETAKECSSYITQTDYERKCLSGELDKNKEKANIHIILDFSSLKEIMSKGGLVMSTCKCPNCNGMIQLPEVGKVLICEYCGAPIKPVDVFEKIKSLIT